MSFQRVQVSEKRFIEPVTLQSDGTALVRGKKVGILDLSERLGFQLTQSIFRGAEANLDGRVENGDSSLLDEAELCDEKWPSDLVRYAVKFHYRRQKPSDRFKGQSIKCPNGYCVLGASNYFAKKAVFTCNDWIPDKRIYEIAIRFFRFTQI
jgi:hypothetical protein